MADGDDMTQIQLRLPRPLRDRIYQAARERGLSANALAVRALDYYMERLVPVEELRLTRDST